MILCDCILLYVIEYVCLGSDADIERALRPIVLRGAEGAGEEVCAVAEEVISSEASGLFGSLAKMAGLTR